MTEEEQQFKGCICPFKLKHYYCSYIAAFSSKCKLFKYNVQINFIENLLKKIVF